MLLDHTFKVCLITQPCCIPASAVPNLQNHPDLSGSMVFGGVLLFNWNTTSDTYVIGPVGSTLFYLGGNVPGVVGGTVTLLGSGPVEGIANGQGIPTYAGELEFNLLVAK